MTVGWVLFFVAVAIVVVAVLVGAARAVRALINSRGHGPPAWFAVLIAAAVLLAVSTGAVVTYLFLPVPVSERTLTNSINRDTGSVGLSSDCSEGAAESWRCNLDDRSGSGYAQYQVTAGRRCWHARRTGIDAETPMPARAEGCTTLRDVLAILE